MNKGRDGGAPTPNDDGADTVRQGMDKSHTGASSREERLAMQLRENLKKRKTLARVKRRADGAR
jgi:hypothetical protein